MINTVKAPQVDIGKLIVSSPHIRRGRPRIAGTGVTVHRVVGWYKLGLTPEEIGDRIGHLDLAQIHAALVYYHANRERVEADMMTEEADDEETERTFLGSRSRRSSPLLICATASNF
jgi:uncharacterized protein (DUF433 family)